MLGIKIICVGKLKEKFYSDAVNEYTKRLGRYCRLEVEEIPECRMPEKPTEADVENALSREADRIQLRIPSGAAVITMCIEGQELDSVQLSQMIERLSVNGASKLCFIIGGSVGLHNKIKEASNFRLSMSKMTFPHHLARVMLLEQLYRSFTIIDGTKYHK